MKKSGELRLSATAEGFRPIKIKPVVVTQVCTIPILPPILCIRAVIVNLNSNLKQSLLAIRAMYFLTKFSNGFESSKPQLCCFFTSCTFFLALLDCICFVWSTAQSYVPPISKKCTFCLINTN